MYHCSIREMNDFEWTCHLFSFTLNTYRGHSLNCNSVWITCIHVELSRSFVDSVSNVIYVYFAISKNHKLHFCDVMKSLTLSIIKFSVGEKIIASVKFVLSVFHQHCISPAEFLVQLPVTICFLFRDVSFCALRSFFAAKLLLLTTNTGSSMWKLPVENSFQEVGFWNLIIHVITMLPLSFRNEIYI